MMKMKMKISMEQDLDLNFRSLLSNNTISPDPDPVARLRNNTESPLDLTPQDPRARIWFLDIVMMVDHL